MTSLLRVFEARQCQFSLNLSTNTQWCIRRRFETSTTESEIVPPQLDGQRSFAGGSATREGISSSYDNDFETNDQTDSPIRFHRSGKYDESLEATQTGGQRQSEEIKLQDWEYLDQNLRRLAGTYRATKKHNLDRSQPIGRVRVLKVQNIRGTKVSQYVVDTEPPKWSITSRQSNSIIWPPTSKKWAQKGFPKYLSPVAYGDLPSRIHDLEKAMGESGSALLDRSMETAAFKRLKKALRMRDPQECFMALVELSSATERDPTSSLLLQVSPNTWSEILRLIDPEHFLGRHGELRQEFSPHYTRVLRAGTVDEHGFHQFYVKFIDHIYRIFVFRRSINPLLPPTLADYKMLLKAARWTGNQGMAKSTWRSLVKNHFRGGAATRVVPDTECFNHYLATLCCNIEPRTWNRPPRTLAGHRVGPDGIKINVSRHFREMAELGLVADMHTLCILMVASGREADLDTVEAILKRVWNIDVEKIMSKAQPRIEQMEGMMPGSPLYPSAELLRTVAHIYGINSAIPTAMRVVDYISRAYAVEIPSQVWYELLQWANVLSMKRRGWKVATNDVLVGQLPPAAVGNLWSIMTSEPYNIKPSMKMYNVCIGNLISNERFGDAQARMQEAWTLHKRQVKILKRAKRLMLAGLKFVPNSLGTEKHIRDFNFLKLQVQRYRQYLRLWLARIIRKGGKSLGNVKSWAHRNVPDLIKQYNAFSPPVISYPIDTGFVELHTHVKAQNRLRMVRREFRSSRRKLKQERSWQRYLKNRKRNPDNNVVFSENVLQQHAK
ncbi:hypothetical protein ACMFMG_002349 [Clarireedia jacksonii]